MSQANVKLGIFQETKATGGLYAREFSGYRVVATEVTSPHHGDIAVFYCEAEHITLETL